MALPGDRIKIFCSTTGTGTTIATNGARVSDMFATVAEAGLTNGCVYHYTIEQGTEWEHSWGPYNSGSNIIDRNVEASRVGGVYGTNKINLNGTQQVYFPLFREIMDKALEFVQRFG